MTKKYSSYKTHQLITENWRKFLNEGDTPEEGEAMEEGFFDAVGDLASRTGVFGKADKKKEFWRRKGEAQAAKHLSNRNVLQSKKDASRLKAAIRDIKRQYLDNDEYEASAVGVGDAATDYRTGVKAKASRRAAAAAETDARAAADDRKKQKSAAAAAAEKEAARKRRDAFGMTISNPAAGYKPEYTGGPGAGSSTNRTRRRNRGELEEGWDDVKDAAGKAI